MDASALSQLQDEELCIVRTKDGEYEATWDKYCECFFLEDADPWDPQHCKPADVIEWRPAAVKF